MLFEGRPGAAVAAGLDTRAVTGSVAGTGPAPATSASLFLALMGKGHAV